MKLQSSRYFDVDFDWGIDYLISIVIVGLMTLISMERKYLVACFI